MTRSTNIKDPQTDAEWQEAVDGADAWLKIDLAIKDGLVKYCGKINAERCREILEQGQKKHIQPRPQALDELLRTLKTSVDFHMKPNSDPDVGSGHNELNELNELTAS